MKKGFTKPLYKYKHSKRTVYIHEVEKVAWMKSMDVQSADIIVRDLFELDRRFGSLFSPLYKLRESFEKQFLGQRYWRALKYDFFKARHYVSEGVEDLFLDDDDDENKEDEEGEDSGN